MDYSRFCQSCGMPLDRSELHGTRKDGSLSKEYCKYCFQEGAFINPAMTLTLMQGTVTEKMTEEKIPADIIEATLGRLPHLKRWRTKVKPYKEKVPFSQIELNEKHPLDKPPAPESLVQTEDELDKIVDEDTGEVYDYEEPEPGEGP